MLQPSHVNARAADLYSFSSELLTAWIRGISRPYPGVAELRWPMGWSTQ